MLELINSVGRPLRRESASGATSFCENNGISHEGYARAIPAEVREKETVTFSVKSPTNGKYLALFAEDNSRVKMWCYSANSVVVGAERVWEVTYTFPNEGNRSLTFKVSRDNVTYGEGKVVALTVKEANAIPDVTSASANVGTTPAKQDVTFTVKTPPRAKYLAMFSGNGSKVKAWGMTGIARFPGQLVSGR